MSNIDPKAARVIRALKSNFPYFAKNILKITTKSADVVPFEMNPPQQKLHDKLEELLKKRGKLRVIIVKGRQLGCSTYVQGRFFWKLYWANKPINAFILTHKEDSTASLFEMTKKFWEYDDTEYRPPLDRSSAKQLIFADNKAAYRVSTAGSEEVGRGMTLQMLHGSEVAFWPKAETHVAALQQAIADVPGTEIILESTADGVGNLFHKYTMASIRSELDFDVVFIPWFWSEDYRTPLPANVWGKPTAYEPPPGMPKEWAAYANAHGLHYDQVYWAYNKNKELAASVGESIDRPCWKFKQEYPATLQEAFQTSGGNSFIRSELVSEARNPPEKVIGHGRIVLGVDVARGSLQGGENEKEGERKGDKVGIIDRCGRVLGSRVCERIDPQGDLNYVAAQVVHWINKISPDEVNIDATGMGVGLVDILRAKGYGKLINPVGFGNAALGKGPTGPMYADRRAEMWDQMREWLEEGGVQIPDDDGLQADLCAPVWSTGSQATYHQPNGALRLEAKSAIKARLGYSPDLGDAAALTFAFPYNTQAQAQYQPQAKRQRSGRVSGY